MYKYVYIYVIHTLLKSASSVIKRMNNQKHIISRLMNAKQNKRISEKKKKKKVGVIIIDIIGWKKL